MTAVVAKVLLFLGSDRIFGNKEQKVTTDDIKRLSIFITGVLVEYFYLNPKGDIFGLGRGNEELGIHLQNFVFSMLLQMFGDCLLIDCYDVAAKDALNIMIAYSATLIFV